MNTIFEGPFRKHLIRSMREDLNISEVLAEDTVQHIETCTNPYCPVGIDMFKYIGRASESMLRSVDPKAASMAVESALELLSNQLKLSETLTPDKLFDAISNASVSIIQELDLLARRTESGDQS